MATVDPAQRLPNNEAPLTYSLSEDTDEAAGAHHRRGASVAESARHAWRARGRTIGTALLAVTATTPALVGQPAHAQDQRPCVSGVEYRTVPGMAYMSGKTNPGAPLNRRPLERLWDVKGLGVIDPEYSNRHTTMWMYPICGYSMADAQVWVMTTGLNGSADTAYRWYEPGAK